MLECDVTEFDAVQDDSSIVSLVGLNEPLFEGITANNIEPTADGTTIAPLQSSARPSSSFQNVQILSPLCANESGNQGINDLNFPNNQAIKQVATQKPSGKQVNSKTKLYQLLQSDSDGRMVICSYEANPFLTPNARNRLVKFIIKTERDKEIRKLSKDGKLSTLTISTKNFKSWAEDIVETFPGECAATYYTEYTSVNGNQMNASGKLWNHFNYTKSVLRKGNLMRNKNKLTPNVPISDSVVDILNTLRTKVHPWHEIIQLWGETYAARRNFLFHDKPQVPEYLEIYACLGMQGAIQLFEYDFLQQFPEKSSSFFDNWKKTREYISNRLRQLKITDPDENGLLHTLPRLQLDEQDTILLYLLPRLIPAARPKKIGKKGDNATGSNNKESEAQSGPPKKIALQEQRDAFIINFENAVSVEEILQRTNGRRNAHSPLSRQPIPVIIGPLAKPAATYIVVGNRVYTTASSLHSMDIAFKTCFALDCKYPPNGHSLWQFIQKAYFKIDIPGESKVSCFVNTLIGEIYQILNSD